MKGELTFTRCAQFDNPGVSTRIGWNHTQRFNSQTSFNAHVDYSTNGAIIQRNSLNPWEVTARVGSSLNFDKRFSWGALNIGGTPDQDLSSANITPTLPTMSPTPSPVDITSCMS